MTSMQGDILNRVKRLPKPSKSSEALQPLLEAVSNALYAVEDRFKESASSAGRINVTIYNLSDADKIKIIVQDNGIGLDLNRYGAFCTTDTDYRMSKGGKGVGRLLWLDSFQEISVISLYENGESLRRRSFNFKLDSLDQLQNELDEAATGDASSVGTIITFRGLRGDAYRTKFPSRPRNIIKHFGSHFLANFILGKSPQVRLDIGDRHAIFPEEIRAMLVEDRGNSVVQTDEFGELLLNSYVFKKAASADFDGVHQLHFIANGRTVMTRKIDGLLGIGRFGQDENHVYHGCVSSQFLDERVNQERTHFNFDDSISEDIAKQCATSIRTQALKGEVDNFDGGRLTSLNEFLSDYPSFAYDSSEALLERTPKNAVKAEQFAQALVVTRIRRDHERRELVNGIVNSIGSLEDNSPSFAERIKQAANEVQAEEQRQLTEYVLRRKMVLDVLQVLISRMRETKTDDQDYFLESTLHQFICPMRLRGDDPTKVEASDHDLWIIDERLAFTRYFASDVPTQQLIKESESGEKPDLVVFERLHGLGNETDEPLRRVMLVEFKKPGRKEYNEKYLPLTQISRYLKELKSGTVENYNNERIRIADDCIFYCYVVADIVGTLDVHTSAWKTTANGRGRWLELGGSYRGTIEVIEWRDLLEDARSRSLSFINAIGLAK